VKDRSELERILKKTAAELGAAVDAPQIRGLFAYGELLLQWAKVINLTGASQLDELVERHFPDALAAGKVIPPGARVLDVGAGGGLPGVPLLVLRPDLEVTLCEPIAKRVAFLRTAVRELSLGPRAHVVAGRVGAGEVIERGDWDVALARAVWNPGEWAERGVAFVRPGGQILVFCVSQTEAEALSPTRVLSYGPDRRLSVVAAPGVMPAS